MILKIAMGNTQIRRLTNTDIFNKSYSVLCYTKK